MPEKIFLKKESAYRAGLYAEILAAAVLIVKGYRIAAWRYKTPMGEIDLIARRGREIVFVEVKWRQTLDEALSSVSGRMQGRIVRAARHFIAARPAIAGFSVRFDLIAAAPPFFWRHLDNAWRPSA